VKLVENDSPKTQGKKGAETGVTRRLNVTGSGGRRVEMRVLGFLSLVAMPQMGVYYFLEKKEQTPKTISLIFIWQKWV
jgi:hypothetical protein